MTLRKLLLCCVACGPALATDSLAYPTPPNPFAQPAQPAQPETTRASRSRRLRPRLQPLLCLGVLSLAGAVTRPHEPSLLAAIDAYHEASGDMSSPWILRDCGVACVAHHNELIWLGLLGRWLPLLPTNLQAARELASK